MKKILIALTSIIAGTVGVFASAVPEVALQQQYLYPQTVYDYRITYLIIGLIVYYIYKNG